MESFLQQVTLMGLFAGVIGTGGGGLIAVIIRCPRPPVLSVILGFSAGVMLVVVFMELLQEAFIVGGLSIALLGLICGILVLWCMDVLLPHLHFVSCSDGHGRYIKTGILLAVGIALHNIPEGLAIGAGYASTVKLGLGLAVIMAVQNIPEGIAVSTALVMGGAVPFRAFIYSALAGIPMGIGAFIGGYLGCISPVFLSFFLSFAAGAMLYIICDELIPDAHQLSGGHPATLGIVFGVVTGLVLHALL